MKNRLFVLLLFSFSTWATSNLVPCPECKCPSNTIPLQENFRVPGPPLKIQPHLSCLEVASNLVNPVTCLLQNNISPTVEQSCQSSVIRTRCPELGSSIPITYRTGEVAPANCGYNWHGFNYRRFFQTVDKYKTDETIECLESMCTSATFLTWVGIVKRLHDQGKIDDDQYEDMTKPGHRAYRILNGNAEPNELVEAYGVGQGSIQYIAEGEVGNDGVPKKGDFVQIWRNSGSGHSVIFKGFIDSDEDGKPDLLCYWSSQPSTNGYANNCEKINTMDRILIGSLDV